MKDQSEMPSDYLDDELDSQITESSPGVKQWVKIIGMFLFTWTVILSPALIYFFVGFEHAVIVALCVLLLNSVMSH